MSAATSKDAIIEMKKQRAQRFGTSVKEVELEKRQKRLERFGNSAQIDYMRQRKRFKNS
jgi:putative transposon-encoded protein